MTSRQIAPRPVPRNQRGAVLFVSLIMLVVLALIGITSMQVTTLQERMAGNYYTLGKAFERAEGKVRERENVINTTVAASAPYKALDERCAGKDMDNWAMGKVAAGGAAWYDERIDNCIPGTSSSKWKQPVSSGTTNIYQITAVNSDGPAATSASLVVIQTVFIP